MKKVNRFPLISNIHHCALDDGPGMRTTVFMKGRPISCRWCHNPESIKASAEIAYYPQLCIGCGKCESICPEHAISFENPTRIIRARCTICCKCAEECPATAIKTIGKYFPPYELIKLLLSDRVFYETSGGGVTFSGGEPFISPEFLLQLLKEAKRHGLHTTVDTTGYTGKENIYSALDYIDLFLFDIKFINDEKHKKYTGVSNRIILDNLNLLRESQANLIVRIPLIPGITDTEENLLEIIDYLKVNNFNFPVECLPYNPIGESKYDRMGIELKSGKKVRQSETFISKIRQNFSAHGFKVLQE